MGRIRFGEACLVLIMALFVRLLAGRARMAACRQAKSG